MRFVLTGDWHLRAQRPQSRKDADYFAAQLGKVEQIIRLAQENDAPILQPGDFFDGTETPWWVVKVYVDLFRAAGVPVYCVRGQHDLRYHSKRVDNTPLAVMEAAEVVEVLEYKSFWKDKLDINMEASLVGMSWGQEDVKYSKVKDQVPVQILLMHRMVVEEKLWFGQEDYIYAADLFRKYPEVDLFVCGDNHKSFVRPSDARRMRPGRYVVNCGSLMRSGIDQVDHRPVAYVYDTGTRDLRPHYLKVRKASEVLDVKRAEAEDARDRELQAFVEGLGGEQELGLDFLENLRATVAKADVAAGVRAIIDEALRRAER